MTAAVWSDGELTVERFDTAWTRSGYVRPQGGVCAVYAAGRLDRITWRNEDGSVELVPAHAVTRLQRKNHEPEVTR